MSGIPGRDVRAALEELEELYDRAPCAYHSLDGEGLVVRANQTELDWLGYARREYVGAVRFADLLTPESLATYQAHSLDVEEGGRVRNLELDLIRKDRTTFPVLLSATVVRDAEGRLHKSLGTMVDIGERKRAEAETAQQLAEAREEKDRLSALMDSIPDEIWFTDAEGRFTMANPAATQEFHVESADEKPVRELAAELEVLRADGTPRPIAEAPPLRALAGETVRNQEEMIRTPATGEFRNRLVNATPIFGDDGAIIGSVSVVRDITDLRRAEELLGREQKRARSYLDIADVMLVAIAPDQTVLLANRKTCEVLGRDEAEIVGSNWFETALPEATRVPVGRTFAGLMADEVPLSEYIENLVVSATGGERLIAWHNTVVRDEDGAIVATLSSGEDITERRRTEDALRESEERYRTVADFTYDWEYWLAPDDRLIYMSPSCERITGYSVDDFMRDPRLLIEIVYPEDRDRVSEHLIHRDASAVHSEDFRIVTRGGEVRWIEHACQRVVDADGRPLGRRASNRDNTARKQAEAEISRLNAELERRVVSRTEQLDAATRELEALAYSIAHDVRTPLRTIDGFSAMAIEDERERLSPEGIEELRRVRLAAQTLARLMDELMGLSDVSRRELARQSVDLSRLAADVGEETAADAPSRDVELTVAPGLTAEADPALVRLILRELLGNAWKFTRGRDPAHVEVGVQDADDERAFFVRDDGVGFDMGRAEHLYGIFQRLHAADEFEGDGVGLATVQRLVRRHGGRVWAESAVGVGATFFFTLPPETRPGPKEATDA